MFCRLKTLSFVAATVCFVFLFVFAPVSASAAAENTVWTKYSNAVPPGTSDSTNWGSGRIPLGTTGQGDDYYVDYPDVIKDGSTYKMWYSGHDQSNWRIYYATSPDGLSWFKYDNNIPDDSDSICTNGTIALGTAGTGDKNGAWGPSVIKDDSLYKMWYTGHDAGNTGRIYYATSSNGLTWTKYTNAIPDNSNTTGTNGCIPLGTSGGDTNNVVSPAVIKDGSTYKMWYAGQSGGKYRIYYATSSNGLTWIKYSNSVPADSNTTGTNGCIPLGTSGGDTADIYGQCVIKDGASYKMWYGGSDGTNFRIYHATSTNGLTWTKYTNAVPPGTSDTTNWGKGRIPLGSTTGTGDEKWARSPTVIKDGSIYKMWYGARDTGNTSRIYYATSSNGLTWTKYTNAIPANSDTNSTLGRIPLGESGGDVNGIQYPCVIKDGYTYKMWYVGTGGGKLRIYLATCDQLPAGIIFYGY